jgi:hypothetical protein
MIGAMSRKLSMSTPSWATARVIRPTSGTV